MYWIIIHYDLQGIIVHSLNCWQNDIIFSAVLFDAQNAHQIDTYGYYRVWEQFCIITALNDNFMFHLSNLSCETE